MNFCASRRPPKDVPSGWGVAAWFSFFFFFFKNYYFWFLEEVFSMIMCFLRVSSDLFLGLSRSFWCFFSFSEFPHTVLCFSSGHGSKSKEGRSGTMFLWKIFLTKQKGFREAFLSKGYLQ